MTFYSKGMKEFPIDIDISFRINKLLVFSPYFESCFRYSTRSLMNYKALMNTYKAYKSILKGLLVTSKVGTQPRDARPRTHSLLPKTVIA
jgi:hypothetical protein